ncbi:MAG: hypothetical protein CNE88_04110 [Acidimicrobiales bacterium MED-G01]|nr:MAG: hypothetical protein CNE88_04110 [Acidimicrobiales bacterium MED-G01]
MVNTGVLELYRGVNERIIGLVRIDQNAILPSCPLWSAIDLLRHVTAVCQDWVAHRLDGYGSEQWTSDGVNRLSALNFDEISFAWSTAIDQMVSLSDEPGMGDPVRYAFGDAAAHEADLRAVLAPGTTLPPEALTLATKSSFVVWRQHLTECGAPDLAIELEQGPTLNVGKRQQNILRISEHELFRMLNGRRSISQIEGYEWSANPEPYIHIGLGGPVTGGVEGRETWAREPLVEPGIN